MEASFYSKCKELDISLFTISHRKTLFKYHDYFLKFDGEGGWEYLDLKQKEVYENVMTLLNK